MTITEFLEARIAEDEAVASLLAKGDAGHSPRTQVYTGAEWVTTPLTTERLLAECAAKRAILARVPRNTDPYDPGGYTSAHTVRVLAAVYADHPDYLPEWAR
jgi:hypothetical protein